jgi:hypothetical protein
MAVMSQTSQVRPPTRLKRVGSSSSQYASLDLEADPEARLAVDAAGHRGAFAELVDQLFSHALVERAVV